VRVVILGPPASGKGTQAREVARLYTLTHLSTGALLRREVDEGTSTGRAVATTLARGDLVDDATVCRVLSRHLAASGDAWLLDGFPRTVGQARALDGDMSDGPVDAVLALRVPEDEVARRVRGRAHREGRPDDSAETLRRRLAVYEEETRPLLDYYAERGVLHEVDGGPPPREVTRALVAALDGG
jgi:adenylate kinase